MTPILRSLPFLVGLASACGAPADQPSDPAAGADSAPAAANPAPTDAAPTDLPALVAEIRGGIAALPATVGADPAAARQEAVRLYATRQEVIEAHWGPNGDRSPTPELAAAVEEAEHRFHALMELLSADPPPTPEAVAGAVAELDAGQAEILRQANVP